MADIGTGTSYGFQAVTEIGAAIEHEANQLDAVAAQHWIDELSRYLDKVDPAGRR